MRNFLYSTEFVGDIDDFIFRDVEWQESQR